MSKYEFIPQGELGRGRFGVVEKVRRRQDQKILARKTISIDGKKDSAISSLREYEIVHSLDHANIAAFVDYDLVPNAQEPKQLRLYMEYYEYHSLDELIRRRSQQGERLPEAYIWSIIYQLSSALTYCHHGIVTAASDSDVLPEPVRAQTVLHRDIKPANVFLASDSETSLDAIKLGDFGVGAILQGQNQSTYVGTREYLPPEIRQSNPGHNKWTIKCDIFSLGCTLFELCDLRRVFDFHVESPSEIAQSLDSQYSKALNSCLKACIDFEPEKRPDARKLFIESQFHMRGNSDYQSAVRNHALLVGASEGHIEQVLRQLDGGAFINAALSTDGETPLHKAIRYGDPALVKFLLASGADLSMRNKEGHMALHTASAYAPENHAIVIVEILLEDGASVTAFDDHGRTPLHHAAAFGRTEVITRLHEWGTDLDLPTRDSQHSRAIHIATENGHGDVVQELELCGANIRATKAGDKMALHIAAETGQTAILKFFLSRGIQATVPFGSNKLTALHQAARFGHERAIMALLESDANARTTSTKGETALHFASAGGHAGAIRLLVRGSSPSTLQSTTTTEVPCILASRLAQLEARTKDRQTALHIAVESGQPKAVAALLTLGSDPRAKTADGDTPLHHAALRGSQSIVSSLLEHDALISARGPYQATPLHYAAHGGHTHMTTFLLNNPFHTAKLDERTYAGDTILHLAVHSGHLSLVLHLLKTLHFPVNTTNNEGETPLHYAAAQGHEDILRELLHFGADFTLKTKGGMTARKTAESASSKGCAERLARLERG